MGEFLTHEPISGCVFNRDYTGGTNTFEAWGRQAQETLLRACSLLCERMEADYCLARPKMRKSFLVWHHSISR